VSSARSAVALLQDEANGVAGLELRSIVNVASAEEHVFVNVGDRDESKVLVRFKGLHDALDERFTGATRAVTSRLAILRRSGRTRRRPGRYRANDGNFVGHDSQIVIFAFGIASDALFDTSTYFDHVAEVHVALDVVCSLPKAVQLNLVRSSGPTRRRHVDLKKHALAGTGTKRTIRNPTNQQHNVHDLIITETETTRAFPDTKGPVA
jgi:hypothetical protein